MNRLVYISLTLIIVSSTLLLNTGYYKCNSKKTVHIYSSCCSQDKVEKSCCSEKKKSNKPELKQKCCDRIDLCSFDKELLVNTVIKSSDNPCSFYPATAFPMVKITPSKFRISSPLKVPIHDESNLHKVYCIYIC